MFEMKMSDYGFVFFFFSPSVARCEISVKDLLVVKGVTHNVGFLPPAVSSHCVKGTQTGMSERTRFHGFFMYVTGSFLTLRLQTLMSCVITSAAFIVPAMKQRLLHHCLSH